MLQEMQRGRVAESAQAGTGNLQHRLVSVMGQNQRKLLRRWRRKRITWELNPGP